MGGNHLFPGKTFYPDPGELQPAVDRIGVRGVSLFLRACLRWLQSDPDTALATLAAHWPPERPTGRPRKKGPGAGTPHVGQRDPDPAAAAAGD